MPLEIRRADARCAMTSCRTSSQQPPRRPDRRRRHGSCCSSNQDLVNNIAALMLDNHDNAADDAKKVLEGKATNIYIKNRGAKEEAVGRGHTEGSKVDKLTDKDSITIICDMTDDDRTMVSRINPWSPSHLVLTEDQIYAFLHDYYHDYDGLRGELGLGAWTCFGERYYDRRSYQFIRPSGNPIGFDGIINAMVSADLRFKKVHLVSIDSITILGEATSAVVVFTCDMCFEYKGIPSEDRAAMTCVLELIKGEIKIVHEHKSNSRPIPQNSRW